MITAAHIATLVAPILTRTVAAGFVTVSINISGTASNLIINVHVMDEFCDMKLSICAMALDDGTHYVSLGALLISITGETLFDSAIGDGRFLLAA